MLRVDLHTHTWFSPDSLTSPRRLVRAARRAGLHRIAVTDHDQIDGAFEAHAIDPELVIIGEEVRCACKTEVIGLFLTRWIPGGLSLEETVAAIREQGGVVYAPHPYAYLTSGRAKAGRVLAHADVVEVFNSRAFFPPWNRKALRRSHELRLPGAASSDSHFPWELGRAYFEVPDFNDRTSFLEAAAGGRAVAVETGNPLLHVSTISIHFVRRLIGLNHGAPFRSSPKRPPVLVE